MNRRPAPADRPAPLPRVTLVASRWGSEEDERQLLARLVAGALTSRALVSVVHVTAGDGAGGGGSAARRDGAFEVTRVGGDRPRPVMQLALLAALRAGGGTITVPDVAGPRLLALDGGRAAGLVDAIDATAPDVVVVAGVQQGWPAVELRSLAHRPRIVLLPLAGDEVRLGLTGYRNFLEMADLICTVTAAEHLRVERALGPCGPVPARRLPFALGVTRAALQHRLVGLGNFDDYVLLLTGFPPGAPRGEYHIDHRSLRAELGVSAIAEVASEGWRVVGKSKSQRVLVAPSRVNLLRFMSHAHVVVDLRPAALFGRETLEAMLLGTPVVAAVGTPAAEHVVASGGGRLYRDWPGMVAAIGELMPSDAHDAAAAGALEWATREHGDQARFVGAVCEAVLGRSG